MECRDRLKQMRTTRGLSCQDVADICGVTAGTIRRWEKKSPMPKVKHIIKLAAYYDVSVDSIIRGINVPVASGDSKNI